MYRWHPTYPCGSQYPAVNAELGQHCGEAEQEKVSLNKNKNKQIWKK